MSAWKEYQVTGNKESLEEYRRECEDYERSWYEEMEEAELDREIALFDEYVTDKLKEQKQ